MASAILSSAKHGAYLAIGLYVAMVLVVSLSAQSPQFISAPIQMTQELRAQSVVVDHSASAGAVGA